MGFQTPQYPLEEILTKVGNGRIQLPDFQRGYKWDDERIRSLLVTITLGHPLGSVMLLQTGNDQVRFKPKPLEGTSVGADAAIDYLLLDGQQRLTSLFQALTRSGVVATKDTRGKLMDRRYYIDLDLAVLDEARRDEAVRSVPGDGLIRRNFGKDVELDVSTPEMERENRLFPLRLISDPDAAVQWLLALDDATAFAKFHTQVFTPTRNYKIPAIQLDNATSKAAVATVFEKVNTGGLTLNVFELLTAMFAGDQAYYHQHGTDFRLIDDWAKTEKVLAAHPVLKKMENTDFLQAITLLATRERNLADSTERPPAISARKEDILKLTLTEYREWAQPVRDALGWVSTFLADQHIHDSAYVPYQKQIVPLAAMRVVLGDKADLAGVRPRIAQWFWCGVLGELYGGSIETRFARDVEQVPTWALAALDTAAAPTTPRTVADAGFRESRLLSLRTRNAAAYKGIYALLMAGGCKDWKYQQAFDQVQYANLAVDIHHVFPRAWCDKHKVDAALRESIVNKTPLAATTNRYIGGVSPAAYLPKIESSAGITPDQLDALLATHEIDATAMREGNFESFFRTRRAALLGLVEEAIGTAALHDVEESELTGGDESPAEFDEWSEEMADDLDDVTPQPEAAA